MKYLRILLLDEAGNEISDDLTLTHRQLIAQENNYYPFGMEMVGTGYSESEGRRHRYGYQGQELEERFGLSWHEFQLRAFDSQLGRWHTQDPYEQYHSAYLGMGNNPVNGIDPDGGYFFGLFGSTSEQRQEARAYADEHDGVVYNITSRKDIHVKGFRKETLTDGKGGVDGESNTNGYKESFYKSFGEEGGVTGKQVLDGVQTALDVGGLVPGLGEPLDAINALIYGARGDYLNAGLSTAAMWPIGGQLATAGKLGGKAYKATTKAVKTSGWVKRSVFNSLEPAIQKKVQAAIKNGIVSPTGKQGIIKLTKTESAKTGFTHKIKILGKGGDLRIYGNQGSNGHILFEKVMGH